jgi:hypothetical protein
MGCVRLWEVIGWTGKLTSKFETTKWNAMFVFYECYPTLGDLYGSKGKFIKIYISAIQL